MAVVKRCIMQRMQSNKVKIQEDAHSSNYFVAKIKARVGCKVPRIDVSYWATVYFDNAGLIYDWKPETRKSELKNGATYMTKDSKLYYWNEATGHFDNMLHEPVRIFQDMLMSFDNCQLPVAEIVK